MHREQETRQNTKNGSTKEKETSQIREIVPWYERDRQEWQLRQGTRGMAPKTQEYCEEREEW